MSSVKWESEISALEARRQKALGMGGPERVERQRQAGKLTVRERIDSLLDPGSFLELGMLATTQSTRSQMAGRYTAADGLIVGYGRINGREVFLGAEDFTVLGGSEGMIGMIKRNRILEIALERKFPFIWLLDGVGARVEETLRGYWVQGDFFLTISRLSGQVPQIGVVVGPCAGGPALMAPLFDFVVMVEGISMLAAGGPPVVEAAIGEKIGKEELGGSKVHCYLTGVADNEAPSEQAAFDMVRRYLSYFPQNSWERPPCLSPDQVRQPPAGDIIELIPRESARPYDMYDVLELIVDQDSLLEIKPTYAASMITTLARIEGQPVGILANQPLVLAGAIDSAAADKATHFIQLCDAFHLPLVFFTDVPGYMTGGKAEREAILRRGLRIAYVLGQCTTPRISIVVRKTFGMGGAAMCGQKMGQALTLAWPTANFGTMPMAGAIRAAHHRDLDESAASMDDIQNSHERYDDIFAPAESFQIDEMIDPNETRARLARVLETLRSDSRPVSYKHGIMP
ncbi:MAG: methylmalonyl-CoA carboxyltransferase [Proteobacteria bacterium]|nr:methylmalonyl-CoA carboxyltransferase [Pseudomonadota bacterium]